MLTRLTNATTAEKCIAQRAQVILLASQGYQNLEIAEVTALERHGVGRWRKRWQESWEALLTIEMNEPQAALERALRDVLRDAFRSGAPGKFTAEQIVQLISIACESPRDSGRPIDDWTGRELADEMRQRAIVDSISVSRVNELLRSMDLQRECQYTRHGTLSLTGSWHVVLGQMIHTTIDATRTGQDFADQIERTIQMDADANWIFVMDNLNTHVGEEVAEPNRSRVRDHLQAGDAPRQLHQHGRFEVQAAGVHQVLQPDVRQAIQLDLHRPAYSITHQSTSSHLARKDTKQKT